MVRKQATDSSLELLLDTITNTFGSVLFLTILVTLMLRTAAPEQAASPSERQQTSVEDSAVLQERIDVAFRETARLRERLATFPPEDATLATLESATLRLDREADDIVAKTAEANGRLLLAQQAAAEADAESGRVDRELAEVEPLAKAEASRRRRLEEAAAALATLAVELDRPVDPVRIEQTVILPVLQVVEKKQVGLYMRYGRLYIMHRWSDAGERLGPNPDHFLVTRGADGSQVATARPEAGFVADAITLQRELPQLLRRFPSDGWVVAVAVYEDSFSQVQSVKSFLVGLGYQYDLIRTGPSKAIEDGGGVARGQ